MQVVQAFHCSDRYRFRRDEVASDMSLRQGRCAAERRIDACGRYVAAGQVYYDKSAAGHKVTIISDAGGLAQAFDGVFSGVASLGGRFFITWKSSGGSTKAPNPNDRSTWIPIVMHLPDSANPITHFDIQGYSDSSAKLPTRILMEASNDGLTWHEVWSNVDEGDALAANTTGFNQWITDGKEAKNASGRPLGEKGLVLSSSTAEVRSYFSWFRLSIAQTGNRSNKLSFRQIGLYDEFGTRLNVGLTLAEPTNAIGVARTILGTVPAAGEVGYDVSAAGRRIKRLSGDWDEVASCFTGIYNNHDGVATSV